MIGQKGVPATHGGIERHVEELAARLVGMGHEVTVFTRPNYTDAQLDEYRGIRLKSLPTVGTKHLDAIVHSLFASFVCWGGKYDVVHYHAIGPCLVSPLSRFRGRKVVATIHGQDWRRGKWGLVASTVLRTAEWMALRIPHSTISVSESLARAYREKTGRPVEYVPNGIKIDPGDDTSVLDEFGLQDKGYIFFAGRLVPEKGAHYLIEAHATAHTTLPLVLAGDTSNSDEYAASLRSQKNSRVVFTGYQYGSKLAALFRHAALFVLPSDLEGLPIVLLEALAYGVPILASDIPPNVEVLGEKGQYFRASDVTDLSRTLTDCLGRLPSLQSQAVAAKERAVQEYDWDKVALQTQQIYCNITATSKPASSSRRSSNTLSP
jgi:glycosyltransferase involved in cell wall biosynthesis